MTPSLPRYLARLGLASSPAADAAGLATLQQAHRERIPFENLDIPLGRPIRIDSESVFAKLVGGAFEGRARGGYCFEQNRLYADMLALLGFAIRPLLARVWLGQDPARDAAPPRSHVLLLVEVAGVPWLADAGFGGSHVPPLPLADGAAAATPDGARHRLRRPAPGEAVDAEWLLERAGPISATDGRAAPHGDWQAQYGFTLAPVAGIDLEQASHWASTRRQTRFTSTAVASIVLPDGFAALAGRRLSLHRAGAHETREIADPGEYRALLAGRFGIALSPAEAAQIFARL